MDVTVQLQGCYITSNEAAATTPTHRHNMYSRLTTTRTLHGDSIGTAGGRVTMAGIMHILEHIASSRELVESDIVVGTDGRCRHVGGGGVAVQNDLHIHGLYVR